MVIRRFGCHRLELMDGYYNLIDDIVGICVGGGVWYDGVGGVWYHWYGVNRVTAHLDASHSNIEHDCGESSLI
jgi:hypothetical protein